MKLAKNIKKLRAKNELVQEDMRDFGLNYRYYQKIEASDANVTLDTLVRLANAFKVKISDLLK